MFCLQSPFLALLFKDYFTHKSFLSLLFSLTGMEAWSLVSTSRVLCTADSVFYCRLNCGGHILVGTKLSLPLDTGNLVLVAHVR